MLKVQNISRRFGPMFALADITFTARRGEILGLIGPNGAGKTTLLEILSGMLPADGGSVLWEESLLAASRRKHVMFYLPEAVTPYPDRRATEVLALFARLFGQPHNRLAAAIEDLALSPILPTRVGALSKGYRRRLLLALGLLAPQPLIMIDEPLTGSISSKHARSWGFFAACVAPTERCSYPFINLVMPSGCATGSCCSQEEA